MVRRERRRQEPAEVESVGVVCACVRGGSESFEWAGYGPAGFAKTSVQSYYR